MLETLPGFDTFRYPAKLMTFAAIVLAVLGGAGWDRLFVKEARRNRIIIVSALMSVLLAVATLLGRDFLVNWFDRSWQPIRSSYYGPLVASKAWGCLFAAFVTTGS